MAKNISLLGADYPDVPAVQLPQTGGGTATFYDINVVDNLNSTSTTDALSAYQGRVLNEKIGQIGFSNPANWAYAISNFSVVVFCAKGTINGTKVGLSIMIPVAEIDGNERYWQVSDAYNSGQDTHFQVKVSTTTFAAAMFYGAGAVSDAVYSVYGF
jgi:hypothetical protein